MCVSINIHTYMYVYKKKLYVCIYIYHPIFPIEITCPAPPSLPCTLMNLAFWRAAGAGAAGATGAAAPIVYEWYNVMVK